MQSANRSGPLIIGLVLFILAGAAALYLAIKPGGVPSPPVPVTEQIVAEQPGANSTSAEDDAELQALTPFQQAKVAKLPPVLQPASRPVLTPAAGTSNVALKNEPTAYTRQLVAGLTNLDFSHGPISKEQAEQWKQTLHSLAAQGGVAVPAIREFLEQNQELNFTAIGGGELLGASSLRSALIDTLAQIGGPEGVGVMLSTLQTTTLPSEIAQLAQHLEQQAPGQYRQEVMNAVQEVLGMAGKGQLPGWDVGTLFTVLQKYGDTSTASALEQLQGQWKYYATMALAGMPNGEGVPSLIRQVQDPAAGGKRDFAFQMLAQMAAQYPDAAAALLEQARANQIPDAAWKKIATGLAGDQYAIGAPQSDAGQNPNALPGLKTYHIESGNQNFYSLPVTTDAQAQQRITLLDQLLGATANSTARSMLEGAKATLGGR